jgi:hypothetical protein
MPILDRKTHVYVSGLSVISFISAIANGIRQDNPTNETQDGSRDGSVIGLDPGTVIDRKAILFL